MQNGQYGIKNRVQQCTLMQGTKSRDTMMVHFEEIRQYCLNTKKNENRKKN